MNKETRRNDEANLSSPTQVAKWPLVVLPSLMLPLVLFFEWHSIEQKVVNNAGLALKDNHNWASIESFNRGRDILLMGNPSSEESLASAKAVLSKVKGVRSVEFGGAIKPVEPSPPELTLFLKPMK